MREYVTAAEMREMDRRAIEEFGIPGVVLMENAGRAVAERAVVMLQGAGGTVAIVCGKGNNGGDGYVVARHLHNRGVAVEIFLFAKRAEVCGDAGVNLNVAERMSLSISKVPGELSLDSFGRKLGRCALIVDGLLGTGARGEVRPLFAGAIVAINACGRSVLAIDIPSGMNADTGVPLGNCVRADATVTFAAKKRGFRNPKAAAYLGELTVAEISIPREVLE